MPTNKNFAYTFFIIFLLIGIILLIFDLYKFAIVQFCISFIVITVYFVDENYLILPNKIWFNFGLLLQKIISPIILLVLYFLIFSSYGIMSRLLSNLSKKKLDKKWIIGFKSSSYFKQY